VSITILNERHDLIVRQALATASALLDAAARDDRPAMRRLLKRTMREPGCTPDLNAVIDAASERFHATVEQILGGARHKEATDARATVCYVGHLIGLSYSHLGRQLDRDHSTVMHACRRVEGDLRLRRIAGDIAQQVGLAVVA